MLHTLRALVIGGSALLAFPALADDWIATKLRGPVFVFLAGHWEPLQRGAAISGDEAVQTAERGYVRFERGAEVIDLGPKSQIQILDQASGFTTVKQYFGDVSVDVEVQNVEHFAVRTPHMAAVVKGTAFSVNSGDGGTTVAVRRGAVLVEDSGRGDTVSLGAGQSASVQPGAVMDVAGTGGPPVVLGPDGRPLPGQRRTAPETAPPSGGTLLGSKDASGDAVAPPPRQPRPALVPPSGDGPDMPSLSDALIPPPPPPDHVRNPPGDQNPGPGGDDDDDDGDDGSSGDDEDDDDDGDEEVDDDDDDDD